MCFDRFNAEGYVDTTAQAALSQAEADERRAWPVVYVCSAYRGNTRLNAIRARQYCRFVVGRHCVPVAPHLLLPQFLSEAKERGLAMKLDYLLLLRCDELWAFGEVTEGMASEIEMAQDEGILVRRFTCEMKEEVRG